MIEMMLTPEQVAERLQLNVATVRRQLQRGALHGIKRGRVWRVPASSVAGGLQEPSHRGAWAQAAQGMADVYKRALESDAELTVSSTAPGAPYEHQDAPTG